VRNPVPFQFQLLPKERAFMHQPEHLAAPTIVAAILTLPLYEQEPFPDNTHVSRESRIERILAIYNAISRALKT